MKWKIRIVLLVVVGAALALWLLYRHRADRSELYSNFGAIFPCCGLAWQTTESGPQPSVNIEFARPFEIDRSSDCCVETLEVPLCMFGASANSAIVSLVEDDHGRPGEVMEAVEITAQLRPYDDSAFPSGYVLTVPLTGSAVLHPDRVYWVVVREGPNAHLGWYQSRPDASGTLLRRVEGTGPWLPTPGGVADVALRVRGRPVR